MENNPTEKQIQQIIEKYVQGTANDSEKAFLEKYYDFFERKNVPLLSDEKRAAIKNELDDVLKKHIEDSKKPAVKRMQFFHWPSVAAAFLFMGLGLYLYHRNNDTASEKISFSVNDLKSNVNKTVLMLADGRKIMLSETSNGKIAEIDGVSITKTADRQLIYHTISASSNIKSALSNSLYTAIGEQYKIELPDGTKLCLNAASSLTFPITFAGAKQRKVELSGEAYFEVTKDNHHPFVVKSATQEVKVLGTHFNVNSYADEPIVKTTLLEGRVEVSSLAVSAAAFPSGSAAAKQKQKVILKPGQQASNAGKRLRVSNVDAEDAVAWKDGDFNFSNETVESAMRKIARWYDVDVIYKGQVAGDRLAFAGKTAKSIKISEVLSILEVTGKVHFNVEGRRITVSR